MSRLLALTIVLVVCAACVGRPQPDATGEEIYLQLCANCHGSSLEGKIGPALGPGSDASQQPDEFLRMTITRGRGRMPSFQTTLDEHQVEVLIRYLREVQGDE